MKHEDAKQGSVVARSSLGNNMTWIDDLTIQCGGVQLQLIESLDLKKSSDDLFTIFKPPSFVNEYVRFLKGIDARNVVEVGIFQGGSAVFFWNLLTPEKLCCIELNRGAKQLTGYIEKQALTSQFKTHFNTNQADKLKLESILDEDFGDEALDVVIDDASHVYSPSLATFEVLFPRLRPGGLYFLEDWKADLMRAHFGQMPEGKEPGLHQLVHDLLDISMAHPNIISNVNCHHNFVIFERGDYKLDAEGFDIHAMLNSDSQVFEH